MVAARRLSGRKRPVVTDSCGVPIGLLVHADDVQGRDGAVPLLASIRKRHPWLRHGFDDGGYAGDTLKGALRRIGQGNREIVKRSDQARGSVVLPRLWLVERTVTWLGRCRRHARAWEKSTASATAFAPIASIRMLTRRLARHCNPA
jgi:transposase